MSRQTFTSALSLGLLTALWVLSGCASTIPNTEVEDTDENRQVVAFMEEYRHALEAVDVGRLLSLAAPDYYDDNGTPGGDDDIDYEALSARLADWEGRVTQVRYEIKYLRVGYQEHSGLVVVEFRYTGRFRTEGSDADSRWSRRVGDQRMELVLDPDSGQYRILSGM